MFFRNYEPQKTWLDKCLKNPIWEDPLRGNVAKGRKSCFNLDDNTFTIFIDHSEGNWVEKGPS